MGSLFLDQKVAVGFELGTFKQASRDTELSSYYLFTCHKTVQRKTERCSLQNTDFLFF